MGIITTLLVAGKVTDFAVKLWKAAAGSEWNSDDVEALAGLLEGSGEVLGNKGKGEARAAAEYTALITRAFRTALEQHQRERGLASISPAWRRLFEGHERERKREIELRIKLALEFLQEQPELDQELRLLDSMSGSPLASPYYEALWKAFTSPNLTDEEGGEVQPLELALGAARKFEEDFQAAYQHALAHTPALRAHLQDLRPLRTMLVQKKLLREMATWGGRHVFGNVTKEELKKAGDGSLPFLALEDQYVEPMAQVVERVEGYARAQLKGPERPIQELLRELTMSATAAKVIVVTADFGSGKSLSARTLAWRLACEFLGSAQRAPELWRPAYVRCAEDFSSDRAVDLEDALRRAHKRTAEQAGHAASHEDASFGWPERDQRFLCLLDGLDEVVLGREELRVLFQRLCDKTSDKHRFVVFTRPGVLPEPRDLGDRVQEVRLLPFGEAKIDEWLAKWSQGTRDTSLAARMPLTREQLEKRGLADLTSTPILLFMIAFTWKQHAGAEGVISKALLYEKFFRQLAHGKADVDRDQHKANQRAEHKPITDASEELLVALGPQQLNVLPKKAGNVDAMLWLMGRVAWQAVKLERNNQALSKSDVAHLLKTELKHSDKEAMELIQVGLVLALQANLRSGDDTILFGHQSFREFLVARYWSQELLRIVRGDEGEWRETPLGLLGAPLLGEQDRSFDFLMQLINQKESPISATGTWTDADRTKLVHWAQRTFNDETLKKASGNDVTPATKLRDDERLYLREAALAIGSNIESSAGLSEGPPGALRSLLASFWLRQVSAIIKARRFKAPKAQLEGSSLAGANFSEADLESANLIDANLIGANFSGANLTRADLTRADLSRADLSHADLQSADLQSAVLQSADLSHANLRGANLRSADLNAANLSRTDLYLAKLSGAKLTGAILTRATLTRATLTSANLTDANLEGAYLNGAYLAGAYLAGADLTGADLNGVNLNGAILTDAILTGTDLSSANRAGAILKHDISDASTRWPVGFVLPKAPPEQIEQDPDDDDTDGGSGPPAD